MAITEKIDTIVSFIEDVKAFLDKVRCISVIIFRFTAVFLTSLLVSAIIDHAQWFLRLFSIMAVTYVCFDLFVWKRDQPKQAEKKALDAPDSLAQILDNYIEIINCRRRRRSSSSSADDDGDAMAPPPPPMPFGAAR